MAAGTDTGSRSLRARLDGAEIAYSDSGSGPATVYAHGLTSSRAADARLGWMDWTPVASAGRRVLSYDARGHGESGGAATPELYTWPHLAEDLVDLLDVWDLAGPVSGIGSSMGTATLLHAVLRAPARFDRLVLTAPPTAWETRAAQAGTYLTMADLVEQRGSGVFAELAGQAPTPAVFAGLENYPPTPDVRDELLPSVFRGASASDFPDPEALRGITQPTLILAWAGDPGHPVSTAERLLDLLPDARLEVATTTEELRTWGERAAAFLAPAA